MARPEDDQIFLVNPQVADQPARLAGYEALMSDGERARQARLVFERDRRAFAVTRALVRTVLSRFAPVAPQDWQFTAGEHGRPRVSGPAGVEAPHFSVSHTAGLIACLVTRQARAAIDVEQLQPVPVDDGLAIAQRNFAPDEKAALLACEGARRRDLFLALWTLKESFLKALGRGLSLPLDAAAFAVAGGAIRARLDPALSAGPTERWRFALWRPSPGHWLALASGATDGTPVSPPGFFRLIPLESEEPQAVELAASSEAAAAA